MLQAVKSNDGGTSEFRATKPGPRQRTTHSGTGSRALFKPGARTSLSDTAAGAVPVTAKRIPKVTGTLAGRNPARMQTATSPNPLAFASKSQNSDRSKRGSQSGPKSSSSSSPPFEYATGDWVMISGTLTHAPEPNLALVIEEDSIHPADIKSPPVMKGFPSPKSTVFTLRVYPKTNEWQVDSPDVVDRSTLHPLAHPPLPPVAHYKWCKMQVFLTPKIKEGHTKEYTYKFGTPVTIPLGKDPSKQGTVHAWVILTIATSDTKINALVAIKNTHEQAWGIALVRNTALKLDTDPNAPLLQDTYDPPTLYNLWKTVVHPTKKVHTNNTLFGAKLGPNPTTLGYIDVYYGDEGPVIRFGWDAKSTESGNLSDIQKVTSLSVQKAEPQRPKKQGPSKAPTPRPAAVRPTLPQWATSKIEAPPTRSKARGHLKATDSGAKRKAENEENGMGSETGSRKRTRQSTFSPISQSLPINAAARNGLVEPKWMQPRGGEGAAVPNLPHSEAAIKQSDYLTLVKRYEDMAKNLQTVIDTQERIARELERVLADQTKTEVRLDRMTEQAKCRSQTSGAGGQPEVSGFSDHYGQYAGQSPAPGRGPRADMPSESERWRQQEQQAYAYEQQVRHMQDRGQSNLLHGFSMIQHLCNQVGGTDMSHRHDLRQAQQGNFSPMGPPMLMSGGQGMFTGLPGGPANMGPHFQAMPPPQHLPPQPYMARSHITEIGGEGPSPSRQGDR
jgi:hypothetical protein